MAKWKSGRSCAHCGLPGAGTDDHIPPQSLYPKQSRQPNSPLFSVPSCAQCNNGANDDDEEFKAIILSAVGYEHYASDHSLDSLARTVSKNRRLWNYFEQSKMVHIPTFDGMTAKRKVIFPSASYAKVILRIVRGLYWCQNNHVALGLEIPIEIFIGGNLPCEPASLLAIWLRFTWSSVNYGTFKFGYINLADGQSLWAMEFFGSTIAYAIVGEHAKGTSERPFLRK